MASKDKADRKDYWNSQTYNSFAGFVPKLTTKVVSYLDPRPNESILDIGCGDGSLTAQIAKASARVLGVDASKSFIETANEKHAALLNETVLYRALLLFLLSLSIALCPKEYSGKHTTTM